MKPRYADLERLRTSFRMHPEDNQIRCELGEVLSQSVVDPTDLEELRALVASYPADPEMRKWLAKSLYSVLFFEREEKELDLSAALFQELKDLGNRYPEEVGIAEPLAMALSYLHDHAVREKDWSIRDQLMRELIELARRFTDSRDIQMWLRSANELERIADKL